MKDILIQITDDTIEALKKGTIKTLSDDELDELYEDIQDIIMADNKRDIKHILGLLKKYNYESSYDLLNKIFMEG